MLEGDRGEGFLLSNIVTQVLLILYDANDRMGKRKKGDIMLDNLVSLSNISFILVFVEGLLSFLSPCVIPLIPIYMSYLAGNAQQTKEDGTIYYQRSKVFLHTMFFVLGVSSVFFILGISFTALGSFFQQNSLLFTRIAGIIIILLGLVQVGFIDIKFLSKERRLKSNFLSKDMSPLTAYIMGLTFSFAWTPCVGPALSSVLIFASTSQSPLIGNLLIVLYGLGFLVPFLLLGLFTSQVLNFLKKHQRLLKYTVKAGGVILIIIGIMTFTGWMNSISKYLNDFTPPIGSGLATEDDSDNEDNNDINDGKDNLVDSNGESDQANDKDPVDNEEIVDEEGFDNDALTATDFTLLDQYGNEHSLSDYKGKVVFLNFWATWCPPCKKEMPDIEALYKEYGENQEDVIILGVANPSSSEYPRNNDVSQEEVIDFLDENSYTFPTVFDHTGQIYASYYISAFPTTFMIDVDNNIFGYVPSMMTKDMMINVIEQTLDSSK